MLEMLNVIIELSSESEDFLLSHPFGKLRNLNLDVAFALIV